MESAVDVAKARRVHMRVDLCRPDVGVPEKLLYRAYVRAVLEHVRGEAVPENVRRYPLRRDSGGESPFPYELEDRLPRERLLEARHEDVSDGEVALGEHVPRRRKIRDERAASRPSDRDDALLGALPDDPQKLAVCDDVLRLHCAELAHAQPAAVHHLEHRAVPQVSGVGSVHLVQHPESLFFRKDARQRLRLLRRFEKLCRVLGDEASLPQELEEHLYRSRAASARGGLPPFRPLFAEKPRYVLALDVTRGGYATLLKVLRKKPEVAGIRRAGVLRHRPLVSERADELVDVRVDQ